jgi:ribosomal protein S18 acetylase RimI-like enzyme
MIKIVRAEEKHIATIGQLWLEFMLFHHKIDPVNTPLENSISDFQENYLQRFMNSEERLALVALDGTKIIGYSLSEIRGSSPGSKPEPFGVINHIAVTETHRRSGIGEMMLKEILQWFQSKDIKHAELATAAGSVVGNSFWQKQGFEIYRHIRYKKI